MTYKGHVENGVIVLNESVEWPDGTIVKVDAIKPAPGKHHPDIERFSGILPEDLDAREAYRKYLRDKHQ